MRALVTGGAGFIGSTLVKRLAASPGIAEVRALDDLSTGYRSILAGHEDLLREGSILDADALEDAVRGVDAVVHLAAIPSVPRSIAQPLASHEANATGTLRVLEAARAAGVGQVIVASSSSVYGANPRLPKDEFDWTRPLSPYAVSKLATEGYAIAYGHSYDMTTLAFRFFNVYGPGQAAGHAYAAVIPKFLEAALAGRPVEIHGDGRQSRDFTYVDTVCEVIETALAEQIGSPDPVNLAYGTPTTLLDLLALLEDALGHPVERTHVDSRRGDVRASQADGERVRALFGGVTPVELPEGLAATVDWFRNGGAAGQR
ncbi:NAD-dependent epimerase/dehydratase family protein [Propioniciclava soli]|uniref:NAD-dependent epimerase/dehydratase family protein n=1 Tax=Propioniciclava soli TaxID=2775081 RepID=A0ABZ3CBS0_9ACTN